jgi:light-regulated signal transduction histidine kinase (bacteriophytochrome)
VEERTADIEAAQGELHLLLPPITLHTDRKGLVLVLRNLLDNALKFHKPGVAPVIEIGGKTEPGRVLLWVRDNGIGFDMRFHEQIFEIFQRLQRIDEYSGTGIGLAIVHKVVERMNGRVWTESALGAGATFYLELPQ